MPVIQGNGTSYSFNGWTVENNVWNPGSLTPSDYTVTINYDPADLPESARYDWTFPAFNGGYDVHAYQEIMYGPSPWWTTSPRDPVGAFPIRISDIASLTSDYNLTYGGTKSGFDVAYDIWLTNAPNGDSSTITTELMIWLHRGGFSPAGGPGWDVHGLGFFRAAYTISPTKTPARHLRGNTSPTSQTPI